MTATNAECRFYDHVAETRLDICSLLLERHKFFNYFGDLNAEIHSASTLSIVHIIFY